MLRFSNRILVFLGRGGREKRCPQTTLHKSCLSPSLDTGYNIAFSMHLKACIRCGTVIQWNLLIQSPTDHKKPAMLMSFSLGQNNVPVNSKSAHSPPPPGQTPGHLTFFKNFGQIPRNVASLDAWGGLPHETDGDARQKI